MSPRTERQFEEIRQEKTQLIMGSALELFANNGYESTSISMIAKKAKISKGLLYNYFASKEELLTTLMNHGFDSLLEKFDPNKDGVLEVYEMESFLRETVQQIKENIHFWKLYWSIYLQPTVFPLMDEKLDSFVKKYTKMMVDYFESQGFKNPVMETLIFGSLLDGIMLDYILKPNLYPIDMVMDELIERYCKHKSTQL